MTGECLTTYFSIVVTFPLCMSINPRSSEYLLSEKACYLQPDPVASRSMSERSETSNHIFSGFKTTLMPYLMASRFCKSWWEDE